MNGFNEFLAMGACIFIVLSASGLMCLVWGLLVRQHVYREGVEELWAARRCAGPNDGDVASRAGEGDASGDPMPTRVKELVPSVQALAARYWAARDDARAAGFSPRPCEATPGPNAQPGPAQAHTSTHSRARSARRSRITAAVAPLSMEQIISGVPEVPRDAPRDALEPSAPLVHLVRNYSRSADLLVQSRELRSEATECLLAGRPERGLLLGRLSELTAAFAELEAEAGAAAAAGAS